MHLKLVRLAIFSALAMGGLGTLDAAPMLRLVKSTVGPVSIAPGANGINQTVEAYNAGDGALALTVTSSATWLTPSVGAAGACTTTTAATSCIPLIFGLNTALLAASTTAYTGIVTVSAPNAVDAPQTITVTVLIGGAVPSSVAAYVSPYAGPTAAASTVSIPFTTSSYLTSKVTTQDGANWLSLTLSGAGSVQSTYPYMINVTPQASNTAGNTYTGSIVTSGSGFAPDNKTIAVTMNVTTLPIVETPAPVNVQVVEGAGSTSSTSYELLGNLGQGTLAISSITASGTGITATNAGNLSNGSGQTVPAVSVTVSSAVTTNSGLEPGQYTGSVTIVTNAANSPTVIPVTFQVVASGAPTVFYQGVVDDAVFGQDGLTVTPGDVVALFGTQLSPQGGTAGLPPLPTSLGSSTSVTVNGETAPLYFASDGQINFQMPADTPLGTALVQVSTVLGQAPAAESFEQSNTVSVQVAPRAPRLLLLYGTGGFGAIVDASQGNGANTLPMPSTVSEPGFITKPASRGDVLTIYAIGLGATSPAVATGQPAPSAEPLARLTSTPTVVFSANRIGTPIDVIVPPTSVAYAGLSPYYAGLYQVNVAIPADSPTGTVQVSLSFADGTASNQVNIQVQ